MLPSARRLFALLAVSAAALSAAPAAAPAVEPGVVIGKRTHLNLDEHAQAAGLGADWARLFVDWSQIEPEKGLYQGHLIEDFDRRIDAYRAKDIKVLVTIFRAPQWAAKDPHADIAKTNQPPADPATYAEFVGLMAHHWHGRVAAYEIWNEPDLAKWWHPAPDPAGYTALLKKAAESIRANDSAAKVISGGTAGGNVAFLEDLYDAGMTGADIDGIGVHMSTACRVDMPGVYYREPDGRIGQFAFTGYRELYQESVERGEGEQIWMTELGISTLTDMCVEGAGAGVRAAGVTEAKQSQFLSEAYACLAADTYVGPAMWFSLQDVDADRARYDHWMGLFNDAGGEKPAASAMRALGGGITPNPSCGGKLDTVSPNVAISAPPVFDERLPIKLTATDAETPVGRMYLTIRKASDPVEAQVQIPGGGQGGTYELNWLGAKELPLDVPHVITGYAYDEAKNLGGASVTVLRSKTAIKVATSSEIDVAAKKGRRAIAKGSLTYTVPAGSAIKGRGRLFFEYHEKTKGKKKAGWVTASKFTILASALRRARVIDKATGKRKATFTKAAKLRGTAKKWRVRFEFEGQDPYQDSRAMQQFKAKG